MSEQSKHKPLHVIAEEAILAMISSEEYQNGKLLPTEIELAEDLNISRNTLRQAINKLVFEGKLCRKRGYGTWVTRKGLTSGAKNWLSFSQEMQQLGVNVKNYELHISTGKAPQEILSFMGIEKEEDSYLLKLERVRGTEKFPFVVFESWFNPSIGVNNDDNFNIPLYELLEKEYGIIVHTSVEEISAQLAGNRIAQKLRISEHDPIIKRKRLVYDINGKPIEYNIGYYKADSFTYTITSER